MKAFRLSVPGNLLFAGEYAVLEEGGLGAAAAVEPRLIVTVEPGPSWEIQGIWPGGGEIWRPEMEDSTFVGRLFSSACEALKLNEGKGLFSLAPARITLDSGNFFSSEGRKLGIGSSAAAACGVTAALAGLGGLVDTDRHPDLRVLHQPAVSSHRAAQGGSGSGYDVTASCFGGYGLFQGGEFPSWKALDASFFPFLVLFRGPAAVRTQSSIEAHRKVQKADPAAARIFRRESDAAVTKLTNADRWDEALPAWRTCRNLSVAWGTRIGIDAVLEPPQPLQGTESSGLFCKALGAGNETGVVAGEASFFPHPLPQGLQKLVFATEGLRWE